MPALARVSLAELAVTDEASFRHVGLYAELRRVLAGAGACFLVPENEPLSWDHASLLNLAFWKGDADVLASRSIPADALMHTAWHVAGSRALGDAARTPAGLLLVEAIASAFDVYLLGRLLGHRPDAEMLETQVPRLTEAALDAGASEEQVEDLLARTSRDPEGSFAEVRRLLFDVSFALVACDGPEEAHRALERTRRGPFAAVLHHWELPTWVLFARAYGRGAGADPALALDARLRASTSEVDLLAREWLGA